MNWYFINSIALCFLFMTLILVVMFIRGRLNKVDEQLESNILEQKQRFNDLQQRLESSEKVAILYQQKITELQSKQTQMQQSFEPLVALQDLMEPKLVELHQQQLEHANILQLIQSESKEQKLYGRAKKMIEMGADLDELVSECEIPRAEAELLISLYR